MKAEIIKKLFDGTPLDGKEAALVANLLKDSTEELPTSILPPYDHAHKMTHDACGLKDADLEKFCDYMRKMVDGREEGKGISGLVEYLDDVCQKDPLMIRIVILNFLKGMHKNPIQLLMEGLLGGRFKQ